MLDKESKRNVIILIIAVPLLLLFIGVTSYYYPSAPEPIENNTPAQIVPWTETVTEPDIIPDAILINPTGEQTKVYLDSKIFKQTLNTLVFICFLIFLILLFK